MPSVVPQAQSLGSRRLYETLLRCVCVGGGSHRLDDVRSFCLASHYRAGAQFDAALQLLLSIGVLIMEGGRLRPREDFVLDSEGHEVGLAILSRLVSRLAAAGEIESFFPSGCLSWGIVDGELNLHLSQIPMRSLPVIKLFRDFGAVLDSDEAAALLKVREPFSGILRTSLSFAVSNSRHTRTFTPEQLAAIQEAQAKQGAEAEAFVLAFELRRLNGHPQLQLVQRVSLMNAAAGYDIESFDGLRSFLPDRFIEVKSYRVFERFFLSSGEFETAKELGERYCLYLVDMEQVDSPGYSPTIIRNPTEQLFGAQTCWVVNPASYELTRMGHQGRQS